MGHLSYLSGTEKCLRRCFLEEQLWPAQFRTGSGGWGCWRVGGLALSDRHFMIADVPGYRKAALILTTTRTAIGSSATTLAAPHGLSDAKAHGRRRTWQEVDVLLLYSPGGADAVVAQLREFVRCVPAPGKLFQTWRQSILAVVIPLKFKRNQMVN
jgi:hypothetical protein